MKVGITGSRHGTNDYQLIAIIEFMQSIPLPAELHHGDCVGVDIEVAAVAMALGWHVISHPPTDTKLYAEFGGNEVREPAPYLERNRAIVNATDCLIVAPISLTHQHKGGTWYTHDYAKKKNKQVYVFWTVS